MALAASRMGLARPQHHLGAPARVTRRVAVCVRANKTSAVGKAVLVEKIAQEASITKAQATKAFDALITGVQEALTSGQKVTVLGFGTFETRSRAERQGRNPRTGEPITIRAAKSPAFKPSAGFKDLVNGTAAPAKPKPAAPTPVAPNPAAAKPAAPKAVAPAPPKAVAPPPRPAASAPPPPATRRATSPPPKGKK